MIDWRFERPLGSQAETGVGVNRNSFAGVDNDFCATLLAMASASVMRAVPRLPTPAIAIRTLSLAPAQPDAEAAVAAVTRKLRRFIDLF